MATTRKSSARKSGTRSTTARRANANGSRTHSSTPERDSHGRFKPDHHVRNAAVSATALVGAVAAGVAAAFKFGLLDRFLPAGEGHDAEDLLIEDGDDQRGPSATRRAAQDFRPDIDAPMSAAEKEALRPPKGTRARVDTDTGTIAAG